MGDIRNLVEEFFDVSENVRPGLTSQLGKGDVASLEKAVDPFFNSIPESLKKVFGLYSGVGSVKNQRFFDLIPGYRLLGITELMDGIREASNNFENFVAVPIFKNMSSDYVVFCFDRRGQEKGVYRCWHDDDEPSMISKSIEDYFVTLISFYREGVFYLDSDGYLDYDFDKEGVVGARLNPGCEYWSE